MKRLRPIFVLSALALLSGVQAQTFNLFAAASLKESATEISKAFQKAHPGVVVSLNFGGSQQLVAQIAQGAPVDVLLSADAEALAHLQYDKTSLRIFATNKLAVVTPAGDGKIRRFQDLGSGLRLIVADAHVPVGHYTDLMLTKAQRTLGQAWVAKFKSSIISKEQDVRAVLSKIELGEGDAGIVYVTDTLAAKGKVRTIAVPDRLNVAAEYPAVLFSDSANAELAKQFIRFLLGAEGQRILKSHGFGLLAPGQRT